MVIIQESSTKYKTFALTNLSYKSLYNLFLSSDYAVSYKTVISAIKYSL
jgi:hypothetical protein